VMDELRVVSSPGHHSDRDAERSRQDHGPR
jgi:hypothetical protein